jgi:Ca-activated chloride channel homolog
VTRVPDSTKKFLIAALAFTASVGIAFWLRRALGHATAYEWPATDLFRGRLVDPALVLSLRAPRMLWLLVLLPWIVGISTRSRSDLSAIQLSLGAFARSFTALAVIFSLGRPALIQREGRVCNVVLVDRSQSLTDEVSSHFRETINVIERHRGDRCLRVVGFAERPGLEWIDEGAGPQASTTPRVSADAHGLATDLASALSFSYGLFPQGTLRHVLFMTDGAETRGDLLSEASRAARFGVRVSVMPARSPPPPEVAVVQLRLPANVRVNQPFDVRATLFSSRSGAASLTLMQGESVNGLDGVRSVRLEPGFNEVQFRSVVRVPGNVTYALRAVARGPDRFSQNNNVAASIEVPGPPSVLYVEGDPAHAQYFRAALAGGDFDVETRSAREAPQTLRELERFDFVVLSDVAAESITAGGRDALVRYVRDLGGGFMMAGGPRGFGLGGWQGTDVERILPVRLESERRQDQPSVALSLVIDRSGSMQGTPLALAQSAALAAARALGPDDLIEVIAFDSDPDRVVRMQSARNRVRIENELRRMRPGGGTAIFPALDAAFQDLAVTRALSRHVILLTDGEGQPDEAGRIRDVVDTMFGEGVTVTSVGLGTSVNRSLLDDIARRGHGRAYYTSDASSLPQIFVRETSLVARSAAVEEPVQPRIVTQASFVRELTGALPYLYGYVSTRARPEPAQVILESDAASPEPLLARWRVGLGWSLAWTSDLKNRWAVEWVRWPRWAPFWTQLVREHMRQRRRNELDLRAEMVGGVAHVVVDAVSEGDRFDNGLVSELSVRSATRGGHDTTVAMHQVAPGRYEVDVPLNQFGAFSLHATHRREGRIVAESRGQVTNPYPREFAVNPGGLALLEAVARVTGGQVDPSLERLWDARGESTKRVKPIWMWFVWAALASLLADLLLRRVRIFDREFRAR